MNRPKIGVGVFVRNGNKFLVGKRISSHGAGKWALPGGHLEGGESFLECSRREVFEETGIHIQPVIQQVTFTNTIFPDLELHYVTLFFLATYDSGLLSNREPEKHSDWGWYDLDNFPTPYFEPLVDVIPLVRRLLC